MAFSVFGKSNVGALPDSSPATTYLPSPSSPRRLSETSFLSDEYLPLPESAFPETADNLHWQLTRAKKLNYFSVLVVVIVGTLTGVALFWHSRAPSPVKIWDPDLRREFQMEPLAKSVIRKFDGYNMARGGLDDEATFNANVALYMSPDLLYESVGFGTWSTPAGWARGEESNYGMAFPETIFTQMLFFGDDHVSTTTTYGSALWSGNLWQVPAPNQWVTLRITDFYNIREEEPGWGRVTYNFMMIDWADALRQVGCHMLPPSPLHEGIVLPPAANDGVPAPLSAIVQAQGRDSQIARSVAEAALQQDWSGSEAVAAASWCDDLIFFGPGGVGLAPNATAYKQHVLGPFRQAFADRNVDVELSTCEGNYCGFFGRLSGNGVGDWLGLPTTGKRISFRFAFHYRVVGEKVVEGWAIFDVPGLFNQTGLDFYSLAAAGGRF